MCKSWKFYVLRPNTVLFKQEFGQLFDKGSNRIKGVLTFMGVMFGFISMMYSSIVISLLTTVKNTTPIDTWDDVLKYPSKKIYAYRGSYQEDLLRRSAFYDQLKGRVELIDKARESKENVIEKYKNVHKGNHVMINYMTSAVQEYRRRLPLSVSCSLPLENLRVSPPLANVPVALIYKKNFKYRSQIDNTLLGLRSVGMMFNHQQEVRRYKDKDGIFSPLKFGKRCPKYQLRSQTGLCKGHQMKSSNINMPISIEHMFWVWILIGFGLCLSLLTFGLEIINYIP